MAVGGRSSARETAVRVVHTIVFDGDRPEIVIGAPGGTQITMGIAQALINALDFGMSMLEAVSSPRFSATSNVIDLSNRIPRSVERELIGLGYQTVRSPLSHTFAWVHGIKITPEGLEGGADPATDGVAHTLTLTPLGGGAAVTLEVPAAGSAAVGLDADTGYLLSGTKGVAAALTFAARGELAGYPIVSPRAADSPLVIRP